VIGMDAAASNTYSLNLAPSQGFAIPINTAMTIARQIENGRSSATVHVGPTAFIGVELPFSVSRQGKGVTIIGVVPGSPAAQAGFKAGVTIVSVDGRSVGSPTALTTLIGGHKPGDRVQIAWTDRSGAHHTSTLQLASGPAH